MKKYKKEFNDANIITVTVELGEVSGNLGDTVVTVRNDASTQWEIKVGRDTFDTPSRMKIHLTGEAERRQLVAACRYIIQCIEKNS